MGNLAVNFALAHKDYIVGAIAGYGFAHIRNVFDFVYDKLDGIPAFHSFVVKYSSQIEEGIAETADEAKKKIEESKAKDAPKP